ncbi:hypothetical protein QNM97_03285 [Gordonia sp. L191]|uniref:hypothetical protein n=1 Tax=Gordonia sp. L191 TaxID=2982699 RepID=UPI0024C02374|nr:hypothetical protein [Gordonia sp. L191]WHU48040.1 hypothetical protein QNM97_03285 [Gordonia sp. L191]
MYDQNSAIPEDAQPELWRRYDEWRGERHRRFTARHAHRLPRWRNRRAYRRVVVAQALAIALMTVGAVIGFFSDVWFLPPWILGAVVTITAQRLLRIITGSVGDAPVSALDEIQLAQRNSARSIAFIVLFSLMFIPYFILIAMSIPDHIDRQAIYGVAILLISLVLAAGVLPSMLTAWWMADSDPEDYAEPESSTWKGELR